MSPSSYPLRDNYAPGCAHVHYFIILLCLMPDDFAHQGKALPITLLRCNAHFTYTLQFIVYITFLLIKARSVTPCEVIREVFGFWIPLPGFRIPLFGFRIPLFGFWIPLFGFWIPLFGFRIPLPGFRIPLFGFRIPLHGFRI